MWLVGLLSLTDGGIFDFIDAKLTGAVMLPLTGLLTVLFVGHRMKPALVAAEMDGISLGLAKLLMVFVRIVAPILVFVVLVFGIDHHYFGDTLGCLSGFTTGEACVKE